MNEDLTLEEIAEGLGKSLAFVDEKVFGMSAHSVDIDGKPKRGTKKPKNNGWSPEEDPEDEDVFEKSEISENEIKVLGYLDSLTDEEFDVKFPDGRDEESAEELKWIFDTVTAFARRAVTNRRKKRRRALIPGKSEKQEVDSPDKDEFLEAEEKTAKKPLKDPKGGLTSAGRAHFKRTEGANLKPGVRGRADTPEKMRRKGSFLTRFFTNPSGPMKDDKGRPTRLALSAAAWGEPVPQNAEDAAALAAKGRRLLERYEKAKKKK
jgi:hypothetical protein